MTLRSKMQLSSGFVLMLTLFVGAIVVAAYVRIPKDLARNREINGAIEDVFSLSVALNDYYFRQLKSATVQWDESSRSLRGHLERLHVTDPSGRALLDELRSTLSEIEPMFSRLTQAQTLNRDHEASRWVRQIIEKLQRMVQVSRRLISEIDAQLDAAERTALVLILAFIFGILIVVLVAAYFFHQMVLAPIGTLREGAEIIGQGDLTYRVSLSSDDEIGELANRFNEMTCNLEALSRTRDEFLSTAAHELKTPITVIKAYTQLLEQESPQEREKQFDEWATVLNHQCNRLDKLIRDLLEISRLQLGKLVLRRARTDLPALIEEVTRELQNITKKHQLVILENAPVFVMADPNRIEQVLFNLLDNAIKYSPKGGDIEIRSVLSGDEVVVSVRDHGIGIPKDRQARVFERFYRAHAGTAYDYATSMGIGLYLAREFVSRHDGRLWFESEEGKGSCFSFSLPLVPRTS